MITVKGQRVDRAVVKVTPIEHKTVETMTDRGILNKLCRGVYGGCEKCEVFTHCRYGQEAGRRNLL